MNLLLKLIRVLKLFRHKNFNSNAEIGKKVKFMKSVQIGKKVKIYNNVRLTDVNIGDYSYVNKNSSINRCEIGKFSSIGENVRVGLGIHPTNLVSTHPYFYSPRFRFSITNKEHGFQEYKKVCIGNDVWVGSYSIIMDGVNVGDGAIIAAGSVVTKDVDAYAIVGGIPAKVIKKRFSDSVCEKLEKSQWWDYDQVDLNQKSDLFLDVDKFVDNL